jgi:hypothetical protein
MPKILQPANWCRAKPRSAPGQSRRFRDVRVTSAYAPRAATKRTWKHFAFVPRAAVSRCRNGVRKKAGLLDHLVGERAQRHCALMFASLMTRPHLSISEPRKESNSSGVEPITTTVSRSSLSLTAGCARAATVSS